jgi:hypothetical protein
LKKRGHKALNLAAKRPLYLGEDFLKFLSHLLLEGLENPFILQQFKDILRA